MSVGFDEGKAVGLSVEKEFVGLVVGIAVLGCFKILRSKWKFIQINKMT